MAEVRIDCTWLVEPEYSGYLVTSPDHPGFICEADSADHAVAKVPELLRDFIEDETAEPVYRFDRPAAP
jgi:hypothetical protein